MKIIILTPYFFPEYNGVTISVYQRCIYFLNFGHEIKLLIPNYYELKDKEKINFLQSEGVQIEEYPTQHAKKSGFKYMPKIFAVKNIVEKNINKYSPDVIIIDDPFTFLLTSLFFPKFKKWKKLNILAIAISHGDTIEGIRKLNYNALAKIIEIIYPKIYRKYNLVIFPSDYIFNRYNKVKNGLVVDFLGVDKDYFFYKKRSKKKNEFIILSVSRIAFDKNIPFLYSIAENFIKFNGINVLWIFVGDGPDYHYWKKRETSNIKFIGSIPYDEVNKYYHQSDLFISACDYESFGLTVIEAMSTGLPVLVPNRGNAPNHFKEGESGLSYNMENREHLIQAIKRLINDYQYRIAIGEKASYKPIDWDTGVRNILKAIQKIRKNHGNKTE